MGGVASSLVLEFLPIAGFVLFFLVFYLNYRAIQELKDNFGRLVDRIEEIGDHLAGFRVEVAERYLRRDEWLAFHNKMETSLKTEMRELKEGIRALRKAS